VYVRSGHRREKVSVVCVWVTVTVRLLMPLSLTRYEKLPELSVEALQASEMLASVVAVIRGSWASSAAFGHDESPPRCSHQRQR
jgi:predicted signal transduction protein with EAL and GGDEF domain